MIPLPDSRLTLASMLADRDRLLRDVAYFEKLCAEHPGPTQEAQLSCVRADLAQVEEELRSYGWPP